MKLTFQVIIGILSLLSYSCNNVEDGSKTKSIDKVRVENNAVKIDYDDSRVGDTTLLFVHGWNINKSYWQNQYTFFSPRYRVVALDLPGFGNSGKNRKSWSVEEYGKDITSILSQLDLKPVILIGHSMSGAIVVEAALKNASRVIGIVGVDNFTNIGAVQSREDSIEAANAYKALRKNYKEVTIQYANQFLFSPSTDSIVRKRVISDFVNADSIIAIDCLEKNDSYPIREKLISLKKVLYLINSSRANTDTLAFTNNKVSYNLFDIGPTGHYPMIEKPNEFNLLLQQAIDKIGRSYE